MPNAMEPMALFVAAAIFAPGLGGSAKPCPLHVDEP